MDIQEKNIPVHVSMIMDGNGRWARERGKERTFGHMAGVESVRACTEAAVETGVKYLSLFAFSEENWNRPDAEVSFLMEMMVKSMLNELPTLMKNGVRFRVLGNMARLSGSLNEAI
ncbi:MAG: di-trans,poly-cis-decaprenylcistransferase, partial [Bacteroidales bacterium]|nr:di-trans,poly-cis-decaprenylcistransferase [Bacteroidales bacterium]